VIDADWIAMTGVMDGSPAVGSARLLARAFETKNDVQGSRCARFRAGIDSSGRVSHLRAADH
jgi:hypothetical protein